MNPFNLLINYFIANSRSEYYNVNDPQEIQKTGLVAGMISTNPIISYLLIENKAKELQVSPVAITTTTGSPGNTTTPTDVILLKLGELDKKLVENQKSMGELAKKVETIEKSSQDNTKSIEDIGAKVVELPKVIERLCALEIKVETILNTKSATVTEVKPTAKK
jgi:hypothetical protein